MNQVNYLEMLMRASCDTISQRGRREFRESRQNTLAGHLVVILLAVATHMNAAGDATLRAGRASADANDDEVRTVPSIQG